MPLPALPTLPWHRSDLEGYPPGSCSLVRRLELFLVLSATRPPGGRQQRLQPGLGQELLLSGPKGWGSGPELWRGDRALAPVSRELESRKTPKAGAAGALL